MPLTRASRIPVVVASGTQALTLDTPVTLLSTTTPGIYVFRLDYDALTVPVTSSIGWGEVAEVIIKSALLSGGTVRQVFFATVMAGTDANTLLVSPELSCPFGLDVILEQPTTAGATGRSLIWSVERT